MDSTSHAPLTLRRTALMLLRMLAISLGAVALWVGIITATDLLLGAEMSLAKHVANAIGIFATAVPLTLILARHVDGVPRAALGLGSVHSAFRTLLLGAVAWLLPAAAGLGVAVSSGWLEIRAGSSVWEVAGATLLLIALVFTFEAFPEELLFRGYIQGRLRMALSPWWSVVAQALLFAVWGTSFWVVGAGWSVLVERAALFFVMGLTLGAIRLMTGSLWATIGFHVAFQVCMQLVLGGRYAVIEVSSEWVFTLATALVAFCASPAIIALIRLAQRNRSGSQQTGAK